MTLQARFNEQARRLFGRIYRDQRIDLDVLKATLDEQLNLYLDHLSSHIKKPISSKDRERILNIIARNNQVGEIISSNEFKTTVHRMKQLIGPVALAFIFCIDGRIPAIFLGGRFANHWEVPAGELKVSKRKSDGEVIPDSSELCEALRKVVTTNKDLLEIIFAHTSLLDLTHGCGAMAAKKQNGEVKADSLEDANLDLIRQTTIPALTNMYNELRIHNGQQPLKTVAIPALYDTDTFGVIFNYDKREDNKEYLSTTELTSEFKDKLDEHFLKYNLIYGSFRERFTSAKYLTTFTQNILKVTEDLLTFKDFDDIRARVFDYILKHYPNLTSNQLKALNFYILRAVAFQYLTGCSSPTKRNIEHPFAQHEEQYMSVSTRGMVIGKFDPKDQGFASTPEDPANAVSFIKTMLSIMSHSKKRTMDTRVLFVCNPINKRDLNENSIQLHKVMDANAELYRSIAEDEVLGGMVLTGKMIPIPVLIDEDTREVLKIIDHSAYI